MHKSKCPVCGSAQTVKNGKRKGVQTYKCQACGYQFRNSTIPSNDEIWNLYMEGKQTISELSHRFGVKRINDQASTERYQQKLGTANH
ncbi:transposase-like zinc-binding domain-containing protein [Hallella bergensis]|uniref:IS1/IS1595 family N-terminal zinc-binding domain-containing protein n=1 Tax=Hallella bergensis TaxID=242750 RepID=UPI00268E4465